MISLRVTRTVTRERKAQKDRTGDQVGTSSQERIDGCAYWPESVTENSDRQETSIVTGVLAVPRGADVTAKDEVSIPGEANGKSFSVIGPSEWDQDNPLNGWNFGFKFFKVQAVY